jgi:hypothetical protein
MVASEPLGPAGLSVYIYGVCTLPNFIICTHLYCTHITAIYCLVNSHCIHLY